MIKRYPAQISFRQGVRNEQSWIGHFVNNDALDEITGKPVRDLKTRIFIEERPGCNGNSYVLTLQGNSAGSRRFSRHATLNEAQAQAIKWAARRFKITVEG